MGKLVTTAAEAIEEIRRQVKDGVDCIKIALDGIQRRDNGELVAAFTQEETDIMFREIRRLGKKAVAHARGREATLYAARAGIDLIFHANHLDDECIEAMLETGSTVSPTLTHPRNTIDFTQPHEPAYLKGRPEHAQREYEIRIPDRPYAPRQVTDFALSNWTDLYTRARVAELRQQQAPRLAAAE